MVNALFAALLLAVFAWAALVARRAHHPLALATSWIVPMVALLGAGLFLVDGLLAVLAAIAGLVIFLGMTLSQRFFRIWASVVVPTAVRGSERLSVPERDHYESLYRILGTLHRALMEDRRLESAEENVRRIGSAIMAIERLEPPTRKWDDVQRELLSRLFTIREAYDAARTSADRMAVDEEWRRRLVDSWSAVDDILAASVTDAA